MCDIEHTPVIPLTGLSSVKFIWLDIC